MAISCFKTSLTILLVSTGLITYFLLATDVFSFREEYSSENQTTTSVKGKHSIKITKVTTIFLPMTKSLGSTIKYNKVTTKLPPTTKSLGSTIKYNKLSTNSISVVPLGIGSKDKVTCNFPVMDPFSSQASSYYRKLGSLRCSGQEDWVIIQNGTVHPSPSALKKHGNISCKFSPLIRGPGDFKNSWGTAVPLTGVSKLEHDFFKVECTSPNKDTYKNMHAGIRVDKKIQQRPIKLPAEATGLNVLIVGFDSTSRMSMMRNMPLTYEHVTKKLGAVVLKGLNVLADGTLGALCPWFTGKLETELPEAKKGYKGAKPVDAYPFLWKNFSEAGYVTMYGEDIAHMYAFSYKMLGFTNPPTDHFMRPFTMEKSAFRKGLCFKSRRIHEIELDWQWQLYQMYPSRPKFSFFFYAMGHDNINDLQYADADVVNFLKKMEAAGHLKNTALFVMGDHGSRFGSIRGTMHGKYEERLPFFSLSLPPWFEKKYPNAARNLRTNADRLTTFFDLHETLVDILKYSPTRRPDAIKRGISLFKEVPANRTCSDAGIVNHWCTCLNWENLNVSRTDVKDAARSLVSYINSLTAPHRNLCISLNISSINTAARVLPNDRLLKYKGMTKERDVFGSKTSQTESIYQISITTAPNQGQYEATVVYDSRKKKYICRKDQISRINKYGNQPICISKIIPILQPYCLCKGAKV